MRQFPMISCDLEVRVTHGVRIHAMQTGNNILTPSNRFGMPNRLIGRGLALSQRPKMAKGKGQKGQYGKGKAGER